MVAILGCSASVKETLADAELKVPDVKFRVIGEYSAVTMLSPTGNVKDPVPENNLISLPELVATIIFVSDGVPDIVAVWPRVRLLEPSVKIPSVSVKVPVTVMSLSSVIPLDLLISRLTIEEIVDEEPGNVEFPFRMRLPLFCMAPPPVKVPFMVNVVFASMIRVAPLETVKLFNS